jgi:t-SNARE complex subunit (syntaxin)
MNVALLERHLKTAGATPRKRHNVLGLMVIALVVLVLIVGAGLALGIFAARLLWSLKTG